MRLRRVGVASVAKLFGVLYGGLGLNQGAMVSIRSLSGVPAGVNAEQDASSILGGLCGIDAIILYPIAFGAVGSLIGAFLAWLYNLAAGTIGGIEMEFEAPLQPEQSATQTAQ